MHKAMDIAGADDADFIKGMIPHLQGAGAIAKGVLAHGKAPGLNELAEGMVVDQELKLPS